MTWLALDAGNSHTVIGVFAPGAASPGDVPAGPRPLRVHRISTHPIGTPEELRAKIRSVLTPQDAAALTDATPVVLASVVPSFTRAARQAFSSIRVIDSGWKFSFEIATDEPARTGVDRLVNAEAAVREYGPGPWILVDSGTTTTICAMTSKRVFVGGAILPGIEACRDALPSRAAQLYSVALEAPRQAIGRGTDAALRSGVILGYASMIDGMIERFARELATIEADFGHAPPRIVVTGGASRLLRELCPALCSSQSVFDPDLTLKGVAYLHATHPVQSPF